MAKSQEVSNKTLLILIVAVTVVTIVSTWFIVSSAFEAQAPINQVDMDGTAKVTLEIESNEEAVVEEVDYGSSAEVAEVGIEIESSE